MSLQQKLMKSKGEECGTAIGRRRWSVGEREAHGWCRKKKIKWRTHEWIDHFITYGGAGRSCPQNWAKISEERTGPRLFRGFSLHPQIFFFISKNYNFDLKFFLSISVVEKVKIKKKKIMKWMSRSVETDLDIRLKWISTSILQKTKKNNEMDVEIRFRKMWSGSWHPFHKKTKKNNETEVNIRFRKMWNKSRHSFHKKQKKNRCRDPFQKNMKRILTSIVQKNKKKKYVKRSLWNRCLDPLSISKKFKMDLDIYFKNKK